MPRVARNDERLRQDAVGPNADRAANPNRVLLKGRVALEQCVMSDNIKAHIRVVIEHRPQQSNRVLLRAADHAGKQERQIHGDTHHAATSS